MSHASTKGFTLVEILVVVSIIASISSVVLVGVKAAQASGRDAGRQSSALQVRNALGLYASDHGGGVPSGAGISGCTTQTSGSVTSYVCKGETAVNNVLGTALVPKYISHIPVDVVNTNGLEYSYITAAPDPVLTAANGGIPTTPTAVFSYVSELKSTDTINNPVVVSTPIGEPNYSSYGSGGYPSGSLIASPSITSFTGPSTLTSNAVGTWTVGVSNPNGTTLTHSFNWGDSTSDSLTSTGSSLNINHTYATVGNYTTTVTVSGAGSPVTASLATAVLAPVPHTLTVNTAGIPGFNYAGYAGGYYTPAGYGNVSSSPAGIDCMNLSISPNSHTSCSASLSGTVTLTAYPYTYNNSSNYVFDGWGGDCASSGTNPTCTLNMDTAKNVVAYIDPNWSWDFGNYATWDLDSATCANYSAQYGGGTTGWHLPTRAELTDAFSTNALGPQHNKKYWTSEETSLTTAYDCTNWWNTGGMGYYISTVCASEPKVVNNNNLRYARCKR